MLRKFLKGHINDNLVPVKLGFHNVAKDISHVQEHLHHIHNRTEQWHHYLYQKGLQLERSVEQLKHDVENKTSQKVRGSIDKLHHEIADLQIQLEHKHRTHTQTHEDVQKLKAQLKHIFEEYNKHIEGLHKKIDDLKAHAIKNSPTQTEIRSLVQDSLQAFKTEWLAEQEKIKKAVQHISSVAHQAREPIPPVQVVEEKVRPLREVANELTPAERTLLGILATANTKLSYKDLAAAYGKSPSTVKTILLSLKRQDIPILEESGDTEKYFYLPEQYKKIILSVRA